MLVVPRSTAQPSGDRAHSCARGARGRPSPPAPAAHGCAHLPVGAPQRVGDAVGRQQGRSSPSSGRPPAQGPMQVPRSSPGRSTVGSETATCHRRTGGAMSRARSRGGISSFANVRTSSVSAVTEAVDDVATGEAPALTARRFLRRCLFRHRPGAAAARAGCAPWHLPQVAASAAGRAKGDLSGPGGLQEGPPGLDFYRRPRRLEMDSTAHAAGPLSGRPRIPW